MLKDLEYLNKRLEDFSNYQIKSRSARGNILSKYPLLKVEFKEKGLSTAVGDEGGFAPMFFDLKRDPQELNDLGSSKEINLEIKENLEKNL